jgi:hypothetical protein
MYNKKKRGYCFCDQTRQKRDGTAYLSDEQVRRQSKQAHQKNRHNCIEYVNPPHSAQLGDFAGQGE